MEKIISRKELEHIGTYKEIFDREPHHNHEIVETEDGSISTIRVSRVFLLA